MEPLQAGTSNRSDSVISREDSGGSELSKYTSLKDIMLPTSPQHGGSTSNLLDASNLSFRNQLLRHAASAYLQSVAFPANRDQDWVPGICEKLKMSFFRLYSCWQLNVLVPFVQIFNQAVHRIRNVVREMVVIT